MQKGPTTQQHHLNYRPRTLSPHNSPYLLVVSNGVAATRVGAERELAMQTSAPILQIKRARTASGRTKPARLTG